MSINDINKKPSDQLLTERQKAIKLKKNHFIFEHILANGEIRIVEVHSSPYNYNSVPILFSIIHDITERKLAQDLFDQTLQNYESLFNTIDAFLFILDEQGNIINANQTVYDRLQFTKEELLGQSVLMVHPPERREEAGRIVVEMLEGKVEYCPIPIMKKNGIQIPVETRVSKGFWNGKPAIFGVTKDISKVKLSEEKFSKVFYLNPSACGLSDLESSKYIEVNNSFCNLFGFNKNEVIGKTAVELGIFSNDTRNEILKQADSQGNVTNAETILFSKSGEIKYVLLSSENIYVQNNLFRFTVVNDITERKQAEEELRKERDIFSEGPVISIIWQYTDGLPVLYVSANVKQILGYSREEILSNQFLYSAIIHPEDKKRIDNEITSNIKNRVDFFEQSYRVKTKSGEYRWVYDFTKIEKDNEGKIHSFRGYMFDQTLLKETELNLIKERRRLNDLIKGTNVGTWEWDILTSDIIVNERWAEIIGYSLDEISPFNVEVWSNFVHPEDLKITLDLLDKQFKSRQDYFEHEIRIKHKNGNWIWVLDFGKVQIWGNDGKPHLMSGIHQDITIRKEFEAEMRQSKERYQSLFENSGTGIIIFDKEGIYQMINKKAAQQFNMPTDEIIGKSIFELLPENIAQKYYIMNMVLLESGGHREYEGSFMLLGNQKSFLIVDQCLKDRNGNNYAVQSSFIDITERKIAEEALRESEEKFYKIFNSSPVAMSLSTISENRYLDVNEEFLRSTERKRIDVIGHTADELNFWVKPEERLLITSKVKEFSSVRNLEFDFPSKTGQINKVLMSADEIIIGKQPCLLISAQNITQLKIAEEEIKLKNTELAQLNASKDKFFSIIAHDLRSPFSGFLGLTQMMSENISNFSIPEIQKLSKSMQAAASNLFQLIENLLQWSRMQGGLIEYHPEICKLNSIINQNIETFNEFARQKEIALLKDINDSIKIYADIPMLNSVLRNLLSNALKFTPRGGKIKIGAKLNSSNKNVEISIKDSGIGMDEETIGKLFKLDQKVSRPGTEKEPSTGLGLLLCKEFIEKHGGRIWVESAENKGTTFYFSLRN